MAELTLDILHQMMIKMEALKPKEPIVVEVVCSYKTELDLIRYGNPDWISLLSPSIHCPDGILVLRYHNEIKLVYLKNKKFK